jgi:hypothetical protein
MIFSSISIFFGNMVYKLYVVVKKNSQTLTSLTWDIRTEPRDLKNVFFKNTSRHQGDIQHSSQNLKNTSSSRGQTLSL